MSFADTLAEIKAIHDKKQRDYSDGVDPFANIRGSEKFGIPGWLGAIMRANDKMVRIQSFAARGSLENESLEDSLLDLATYAAIALTLYQEQASPPKVIGRVIPICMVCGHTQSHCFCKDDTMPGLICDKCNQIPNRCTCDELGAQDE